MNPDVTAHLANIHGHRGRRRFAFCTRPPAAGGGRLAGDRDPRRLPDSADRRVLRAGQRGLRNLTAAGIRAFTAAAPEQTCTAAYDQLHHTLHHKQPDNDNSGYTAKAYRSTVATFMANLKISVRGTRASVHGPSGLGPSKLVEMGGHWRFSAYPPTVES